MLDWLMEPINRILDWLFSGIYDFIVETFAYLIEVGTLWFIKLSLAMSAFAWDIAEQIIQNVGLSDALNSAWSTIPGDTASVLAFFGIPTVVNVILNSLVAKYVMKFLPLVGK